MNERYSIDADPDGIRALVADAIHGALAFGFQGVKPPPEGHWLTMFWKIGRDALAAQPAAEPTNAMVDAYLQAQRRAVEEADRFGRPNIGGLHTDTVREACRAGLKAAIAAAQPARAGGDAPTWECRYIADHRPEKGWSEWHPCTPAEAQDMMHEPSRNGFTYMARHAALAAAPQPAPAEQPAVWGYERQRALMEANRSEAADLWDKGMPMTEQDRRLFRYGFDSGWTRGRAVKSVEQPAGGAVPAHLLEQWRDAYASFTGHFDTPVARRKDETEYAQDARARLSRFNEVMLSAAPAAVERDAYRVFKDGAQWCAVGPAFVNLQESPAGFADTPCLALEQLCKTEGTAS